MISGDTDGMIFYLRNLKESQKLKKFLKPFNQIILVGGCFDVLHYGHLTFFKRAKKERGSLVVLLESDGSVRSKKKRKPIHTQNQRAELIAAISYVDAVIAIPHLRKDEEYLALLKIIKPAVIAVTAGDKLLQHKKNQAILLGAKVRVVTSHIKGFSTSLITNYATISGN